MKSIYSNLADEWYIINNSGKNPKVVVLNVGGSELVKDAKTFEKYFS